MTNKSSAVDGSSPVPPPLSRGARSATEPLKNLFRYYTFVDFATQAYSILVAATVLVLHNGTVPHWQWFLGAHLLGSSLIHWLVISYGNARQPGKLLTTLRHFYPVITYLWFFTELGWLNRMLFTAYLDPAVVRLEQAAFGLQPSRWLMERLPYLFVSEIFYASYFSYYVMILGVGIALYARDRGHFFHYISVVSFVFYVCYVLYIILPVVGPPIFYFQAQGAVLPEDVRTLFADSTFPEPITRGIFFKLMALLYRSFDSPGAALPSSHVAVALTTVVFSFRYLRKIRYVHLVVAILLCIATVYCRYHYVVDVITGLFSAAILIPLGNRLYFKFENRERRDANMLQSSMRRS